MIHKDITSFMPALYSYAIIPPAPILLYLAYEIDNKQITIHIPQYMYKYRLFLHDYALANRIVREQIRSEGNK